MVGAAAPKPMHERKSFADTWMEPVQEPLVVWTVRLVESIACVKFTAIVVLGEAEAPSAGEVLETSGAATQLPEPSQRVPPFWLHDVPNITAGFDATPAVQTSLVH